MTALGPGDTVRLDLDATPFGGVFATVIDVQADAAWVWVGGESGECTTVALVSELQKVTA